MKKKKKSSIIFSKITLRALAEKEISSLDRTKAA
jgi:hypothetical protein